MPCSQLIYLLYCCTCFFIHFFLEFVKILLKINPVFQHTCTSSSFISPENTASIHSPIKLKYHIELDQRSSQDYCKILIKITVHVDRKSSSQSPTCSHPISFCTVVSMFQLDHGILMKMSWDGVKIPINHSLLSLRLSSK